MEWWTRRSLPLSGLFRLVQARPQAPVDRHLHHLGFQHSHLQPQAHAQAVMYFHLVPLEARPSPLETPGYLGAELHLRWQPRPTIQCDRVFVYLAGCSDGERHLRVSFRLHAVTITVIILYQTPGDRNTIPASSADSMPHNSCTSPSSSPPPLRSTLPARGLLFFSPVPFC